ncbi:conserved hypothetical protein (plasmid) [Trichormus variabilis ATCC 29413]|uniref:Uncharacterized protein n=2 Tax=Anabaena variabilis TaxID=264691 RepID=Q3M288_TRIV2|nr:conserved hypothetical protein [Trichormus variabilis ATCC 29413]
MWSQFIARCQSQDTTATAMLTNFIGLYLDDSLNDPDPIADDDLEKNLLDSQLQKLQSASAKVRDVY